MVVGFNHNFRYKGEVYHIQTEDSGLKNPNIVTLLYQGGTILASKKTSYADITKVDNLEQVVEELMKEQHKEMLRNLKSGAFDVVIERFHSNRRTMPQSAEKMTGPSTPSVQQTAPASPPARPAKAPITQDAEVSQAQQKPTPAAISIPSPLASAASAAKTTPASTELSLDEVILSYLIGDDK